jgi:phosphatidylglycerol---prolipoprotein diacylglyceryl transferase
MYKEIDFLNGNPIASYNVLLAAGMIAFFLTLEKICKRNAISFYLRDKIYSAVLFSALFAVTGAILAEAIYHRKDNGLEFSGFTFYGGFVMSLIGLFIFSKMNKIDFLFLANSLILPLTLSHAFGRIGCFLGGCCHGVPTNSFVGVKYPIGSLPHKHLGEQYLHPTQLYESLFLFLLCVVLTKSKIENRFIIYLLTYPTVRFLIEWYRGDDRGVLWSSYLSPSQEISIVFFLLGLLILQYKSKNSRKICNNI